MRPDGHQHGLARLDDSARLRRLGEPITQPFLVYLYAETAVFYLAFAGDVYMTNALVRWHGPQVEGNPRVRRMYESLRFFGSWLAALFVAVVYIVLMLFGSQPWPYAPFAVALSGSVFPLLAVLNLARGSAVFYRLKKLRASASAPLSSAAN